MADGFLNTLVRLAEEGKLANAAATESVELADVWRSLADGSRKVVTCFGDTQYLGLVTSEPTPNPTGKLDSRTRAILEAVLSGDCQNRVAIESGLSSASVATSCRVGLEAMGYRGLVSRASPVLMRAAYAATKSRAPVPARFGHINIVGHTRYETIGIERPEKAWSRNFSASELEVVARLVDGATYTDIASFRGTSVRTVANQISSAFRRLHVSGRGELVTALFRATVDCAPARDAPWVRSVGASL
ncbi:MAG TPA: LuxR C-terminal-related transcriptional regulator [Polyangiaceae bacterium]|nr:LuxR C-terminal-related transcriptional regulator [Polyangiaceae bacterium]